MKGHVIVAEAREYLGTKYRHQARLKGTAVDCAGLIVGVGKTLGLTNFDSLNYAPVADGADLTRACEENMLNISQLGLPMQLGDVLLFTFGKAATHLAIVADHQQGGFSIIHSYAPSRKVIEARLDKTWLNRIVSTYRFFGVDNGT